MSRFSSWKVWNQNRQRENISLPSGCHLCAFSGHQERHQLGVLSTPYFSSMLCREQWLHDGFGSVAGRCFLPFFYISSGKKIPIGLLYYYYYYYYCSVLVQCVETWTKHQVTPWPQWRVAVTSLVVVTFTVTLLHWRADENCKWNGTKYSVYVFFFNRIFTHSYPTLNVNSHHCVYLK